MGTHALPDLPYDYTALERASPGRSWNCTTQTPRRLAKGANDALEQLAEAREKNQITPAGLVGLEKAYAFNLRPRPAHA